MLRLIKEAEEKDVKTLVEPVPAEDISLDNDQEKIEGQDVTDVSADAQTALSDDVIKNAYSDSVNNLIQTTWDLISNINAVSTTFDFDYNQDNKEEILSILNAMVDDITINIGMLHKVSELIDLKTIELLDTGKDKAEEIANNT